VVELRPELLDVVELALELTDLTVTLRCCGFALCVNNSMSRGKIASMKASTCVGSIVGPPVRSSLKPSSSLPDDWSSLTG
jgi:hypothetical protein